MAENEPKITIELELSLSQLLGLVVYPDNGGDGDHLSVSDLVAAEIVDRVGTSEIWGIVREQVKSRVAARVTAALDQEPSGENTLHTLIIREVRAQLGPEHTYSGTATPMSQWVSAEIYRVIREEGLPIIEDIRQRAESVARQAVREEEMDRMWPR